MVLFRIAYTKVAISWARDEHVISNSRAKISNVIAANKGKLIFLPNTWFSHTRSHMYVYDHTYKGL